MATEAREAVDAAGERRMPDAILDEFGTRIAASRAAAKTIVRSTSSTTSTKTRQVHPAYAPDSPDGAFTHMDDDGIDHGMRTPRGNPSNLTDSATAE